MLNVAQVKNKVKIFLAVLFGMMLFVQIPVSAQIIQRGESVPQDSTVPASYHQHAIEFETSDGVKLVGYVLGSGDKGVTLGHASGWTLKSMVPFANELVARGYKVIMWDYRNNAPSDIIPASDPKSYRIDNDVLAAVDVLRGEGVNQFFMLGASIGGTSTTVAASQTKGLVGLGILSSPRTFGGGVVNAIDAIRKISVPSFFAVSTHDFSGNYYAEVKALYDSSPARDKVFKTIDSGEHGFDMLLAPDKYLEGIERETPYQFTKDSAPLSKMNQDLLDFIDHSFGKVENAGSSDASSTESSSATKNVTSSSKNQVSSSQTEKSSHSQIPKMLLLAGIVVIVAAILIAVRILFFTKRK